MQYTIYLTDDCNLRCRYCRHEKQPRHISPETARRAIDLALSHSGRSLGIGFYGGEPLLQKPLIRDLIAYTKEHNADGKRVFFKLTTNGTLLDDEFLAYAKTERIMISLSIDGGAIAHDKNRVRVDGTGSYAAVSDAARRLIAVNRYAAAMTTLTADTVPHFCESVESIYNLGFTNVVVSVDYGADWNEASLRELERQYKKIARLYYDYTISERKFFFSPIDSKIESHVNKTEYCGKRCKLGYEQFVIDTAGDVYPCMQFVGEIEYKLGSVNDGDVNKGKIDQTRRREIFNKSRIEHEECKACALRDRCLHTCACVNKFATGDINTPSPVLCRTQQITIMTADKIAARLYKKRDGMFIQKHYNKNYPLISIVEDATEGKGDKQN